MNWLFMRRRVVEVLTLLIIILVILSLVTMPWPANLVLVSLVLITALVVFLYERRSKKES